MFMKKNLKVFLLITLFCILPSLLIAENNLTSTDLDAIKKLMNYRPEFTAKNPEEALIAIQEYENKFFTENDKKNFSEQGNLILESIFVSEKFNYLYEMDENHPEREPLIIPHNTKLETWIKSHKEEEISSWLYFVAGDLLSASMGLYSVPKAMEIGLVIKDYYEIALKKNPNMPYINLNLAQWYFHAPAIGGGSKKKANELFQVALKNATEKGEKFYVNLIYSQFMYDQKDKKAATEYLNKAYALQPDSQKIAFLKLLNENDFTLFYYTLNRAKVEKKLGL